MSSTVLTSSPPASGVPVQRAAVRRVAAQHHHRPASAGDPAPEWEDSDLVPAARGGSRAAYEILYERHRSSAYRQARQMVGSESEADDLVAEAFALILTTLRRGSSGPTFAFRAYLRTTIRNIARTAARRARRFQYSEDVETTAIGAGVVDTIAEPFEDTAVAGLERTLAARAFARLPERWQAVLWHVEVEGQSPAEVAPLLGLTANGVSALAYRAREGLRQAYLQVHVPDPDTGSPGCQATACKLGARARDGLSRRAAAQVDHHLDGCPACRAILAGLPAELPARAGGR